jgi:hypothetical protein
VWVHLYVSEKLREFEDERLARARIAAVKRTLARKPTATSRLATMAGRRLRLTGEFLELWATPASERAPRERAGVGRRHSHAVSRRIG